MDLVAAGDVVLVMENEGNATARRSHLVDTTISTKLSIGKGSCFVKELFGKPYGGIFTLKGGQLVPCTPNPEFEEIDACDVDEITQDNRSLVDTNTAQQLSAEEIRDMKHKGVDGEQIVNALIQNSATFATKTEYSQQKYIKKKRAKFAAYFRLARPTVFSVCQHYFENKAQKICNLRPDSLSRMLFCANIGASNNEGGASGQIVLIVERSMGLLTAAAASAIDGSGMVLHAYLEQNPRLESLRHLDFPDHILESIHAAPLKDILQVAASSSAPDADKPDAENEMKIDKETEGQDTIISMQTDNHDQQQTADTETADKHADQQGEPEGERDGHKQSEGESEKAGGEGEAKPQETETLTSVDTTAAQEQKPKKRRTFQKMTGEAAREKISAVGGVDALLVVSEEDPSDAFVSLISLLAPGRNFCFFCPTQQFLVRCHELGMQSGMAHCMSLSDVWTREYQVLPGRSHPLTSMSAASGFILTGIRIVPETQPPPKFTAAPRKQKRQRR